MFWIWRNCVWKEICSWVRKLFYCTSMGSLSMGYCGLTVSHNNSLVSEAGIWLFIRKQLIPKHRLTQRSCRWGKKKKSQKTVLNDEEMHGVRVWSYNGGCPSVYSAVDGGVWSIYHCSVLPWGNLPHKVDEEWQLPLSSLISVCLLSSLLFCHDCFRLLEMSCLSMRAKKIMFVFIGFMHYTCAPSRCT